MGQKLELTWVGKDKPLNIEPRILIEDKARSFISANDDESECENMLIHGDNLLALKALEKRYANQVKFVAIDPPYNTGAAFENYDDNMEHSIWLNLMRARIEILYKLLADEGFLACQIDDSEGQYLKVLLDEIFGRQNYLTTMYIRVRYPEKTLKEDMIFHKEIEQIHVYRKTQKAIPNLTTVETGFDKFQYKINELTKPTKTLNLGGKRVDIFTKDQYEIIKTEGSVNDLKEIWATGTILDGNSSGRFFRDYFTGRYDEDGYGVLYKVYGIGDDQYSHRYFTGPKKIGATKGKYFQGVPIDKMNTGKIIKSMPINSFHDFAGNFGNCRHEGGSGFRGGKKPEALMKMLIEHFTNSGDIVIDSFLGSGTTSAVAHKMNRKWIGIEMGEHAYTLCQERLKRVVNGDKTGISKEVNWKGGGGYRFYELAPSLINQDTFGEYVINKDYNPDMLAGAVALHEGFTYEPSEELFWKQSRGTEKSYLFVTTNHLTEKHLNVIRNDLGEDEFLIISCKSFDNGLDKLFKNIIIKKIPEMLLSKCEFGVSDYNLNIIHPPVYDDEYEEECGFDE